MTGEANQDLIHQDPSYPKLVTDVEAAHELANIAADEGINPSLKREKELAEGMTITQKENLDAINNLPGKFPDAFVDGTLYDKSGRPFLLTKSSPNQPNVLITQDGVFLLGGFNEGSKVLMGQSREPVMTENFVNTSYFGNIRPSDSAMNISYHANLKDGSLAGFMISEWNDKTKYCPSIRDAVALGLKPALENVQSSHQNDPKPQAQPSNVMDLF